jgi:hypothetical protein
MASSLFRQRDRIASTEILRRHIDAARERFAASHAKFDDSSHCRGAMPTPC